MVKLGGQKLDYIPKQNKSLVRIGSQQETAFRSFLDLRMDLYSGRTNRIILDSRLSN